MDRLRPRRRTRRRGAVGRAARPRCARPPTLGLAAQARLGSRPCNLVWCDRSHRRPRAPGGRFRLRGKIRKRGARFVARRRDRRGARAFAQRTRQHRRAPAPQPPGGAAAARPLATAIAFELAIALLILSLVALWRFTPPPRALAVAAPISLHLHGEKAMAEIEIERNGAAAAASLLLLDGAFRPLAAKEVTLVLATPAAGIEPMRRIARRAGETNWRIHDLRIPVP